MAVVTEPPWVNQASGVAARNGTTSHTIAFGFTSTSGNELVVVVFGAVTHTAAGWTERLQPVNSGELSVFTKTSAGDSSITVTHNSSNYPAPWVVYEFPAGTTWVNGTGASGSSDTFPLLTGLPGAEVVVFGGRSRSSATASGTAASSTVAAPWVEDADLFVADDGVTDGAYLYVTRQINVTATSATPAATSTYTGSWTTADRQHVTFALNVAASAGGGSTVSPAGLSVAVALGSPSLDWSAGVSPDGISAPAALGSPILGAAGVSPDGIGVAVDLGSPALVWSGAVAPDGISAPVVPGSPGVGAAGLAPDGVAVPVLLGAPAAVWAAQSGPEGLLIAVAVGAPAVRIPGQGVRRPTTVPVSRPTGGPVIRPAAVAVARPSL